MDGNSIQQTHNETSKDQASVINTLIEECANLTEDFKDAKEKQKRYTIKRYALGTSVLVKRIQFQHDRKWYAILKKNVAEMMNQTDANQRELQELKDKRIQDRVEKCQEFSTIALNRGNKFKQAQTEYLAENLTKCTQDFRQTSEVLDKKLSETEKHLHEEEKRYLEYLDVQAGREESKLNLVLQHIRSVNKELHSITQSADNKLQAIQNKIKLRKEALTKFKAKATVSPGNYPLKH